jgi:peptidyl-prolyl cis-trans isomerase A (cyclophilin A)
MKIYFWSVLTVLILAGCGSSEPGLMDPAATGEQAPENFKVRFETTRGPFVVEVHRDWAPIGADRFYNLVKMGYFSDIALFRVIKGFVVQFGISGDPEVSARWKDAAIPDEPVRAQNRRGFLTYAMGGPNSRTTQLFISLVDNVRLDRMGFAPFGEVVEGMTIVDSFYGGYGEGAPQGQGPSQDRIYAEGNRYLRESFPKLDYIVKAEIVN